MNVTRSTRRLRTEILVMALPMAAIYCLSFATAAPAAQIFANNAAWFRADVGVLNTSALPATNGNSVGTWKDQSVSGFDVTQATAGKQPIYIAAGANGLPTVQFDNSGGAAGTDGLTNTVNNVVAAGSARTVLVAAQAGASSPGGTLFAFRRTTPVMTLSQMLITPTFYVYSDGITVNGDIPNPANATLNEIRASFVTSYNTVVGSKIGVNLNGTQRTVNLGVVTSDSGATGFAVGSRDDQPTGAFDWNGQISEVQVYSRVLNTAENTIATNYLSSKYNSTLSGNDRYTGDTPANGNYDFEVFGIGRDNATTNLAPAGTVSTGTAGTGLALAELNSSLAAGDYLLGGQKNGANSITSSDAGPGASTRWNRVWFVEQTGTVDARLTFDYSDSGLAFPSLGPNDMFVLLYSATDPFSFNSLNATASLVGDAVSFDLLSAQLPLGYYTLGILTVPEPSTLTLLGLGALGMAIRVRRRRRAA